MRRHRIEPRQGWQQQVASVGLTFHTLEDGTPYWDESAYWEFSAAEIDRIEAATAEVQRLALEAGQVILDRDWLARMGIPPEAGTHIREMWAVEPPALYGRLDLAFDGHQIKLLEYNADTPTALVESAVAQWYWLEERFPHSDQFNSLHEKLVAKWKDLVPYVAETVHFAHDGSNEDAMTVTYLRDTAQQAGLQTQALLMREIGWKHAENHFVDLTGQPIQTLFKLYPWEWLLADQFGAKALASMGALRPEPTRTQWLEPIWKMLWSNKALLAILWELYPNHELLLPAYLDGPRNLQNYVRKPLFGREGAGITIFRDWKETDDQQRSLPSNQGSRLHPTQLSPIPSTELCVWQAMASMAQSDGKTAVFGSWLIDGQPAGMGIRESDGLITNNTSRFVPHLFH